MKCTLQDRTFHLSKKSYFKNFLFVRRSAGNKVERGSTADSLQYEQGRSVLEPEAASHALRLPEELQPLSNSTITTPIKTVFIKLLCDSHYCLNSIRAEPFECI